MQTRLRRNPLVHVLIITIVLVVAIVGIKTNHFGIGQHASRNLSFAGSATPVSVSEQNQLLATARTLRNQGRYEEALSSLQPVIASTNSATIGAALLETAKNDIAIGNTGSAMDVLHELRGKYPTSLESDEAQFYVATLEAARGNLSAAIGDLKAYENRHAEIAPYINLLIAGYQEKRGELNDALNLAQSVATSEVALRTKVDALEKLREIQQKKKDEAGYLETTSKLLALATIPSYRAQLIYQRAASELKLGQKDAALADMRTVVQMYPDSGYASNAANDLTRLVGTSAVTDQQRGLIAFLNGSYQSAAVTFQAILSSNPENDTAWYYRAMSVLRGGDSWTAAIALNAMADRFPNSSLTPQALYTAGKLFEEDGDVKDARSAYEAIIKLAPQSVQATQGRLRLGIILYEAGEYQKLISTLSPIHGASATQAQSSFWEGKAYQQLGEPTKAAQAWTNAAIVDPNGFYGLLANQLLGGGSPVALDQPATAITTTLSQDDSAALSTWFGTQGTTEAAAQFQVEHDSDYQRMDLLFELGLSTQSEWEMNGLADKFGDNPPLLAALGEMLAKSGRYNASYRVGIRLQIVSDTNGLGLPNALQRLAYPIAYPGLVHDQATSRHVDPYLFLALMRQESGYDPTVTSSADARGLAQVVPATAAEIASGLRVPNWNADMLYRPYIAIQFGTVFLSDRLQKYNGQIFPALAGYNAGDGNVAKWMSTGEIGDPDVFVERIPFPETHDYVMIVYANYLNYLRLYR